MPLSLTRNPNTDVLIQKLRAVPIGGEITYEELSTALAADVRGRRGRGWLRSARRVVVGDAIVFDVVTGRGLRRLNNQEIAALPARFVRSIQRLVARAQALQIAVDPSALSEIDRTTYYARSGLLAMVGAAATRPTEKRLVAAASSVGPLTLGAVIDAFKKG